MKWIVRIGFIQTTWSNQCDYFAHIYWSERKTKCEKECLVNAKCRLHFIKFSMQFFILYIYKYILLVAEIHLFATKCFKTIMANEMENLLYFCTFGSDVVLLEFIVIGIITANVFKYTEIHLIRWSISFVHT